jgi:hypothetical protein
LSARRSLRRLWDAASRSRPWGCSRYGRRGTRGLLVCIPIATWWRRHDDGLCVRRRPWPHRYVSVALRNPARRRTRRRRDSALELAAGTLGVWDGPRPWQPVELEGQGKGKPCTPSASKRGSTATATWAMGQARIRRS